MSLVPSKDDAVLGSDIGFFRIPPVFETIGADMLDRDILEMNHVTVVSSGRDWLQFRLALLRPSLVAWAAKVGDGYEAHCSHEVCVSISELSKKNKGMRSPTEEGAVRLILEALANEIDRGVELGLQPQSSWLVESEQFPDSIKPLPDLDPMSNSAPRPEIKTFIHYGFSEARSIKQNEEGLEQYVDMLLERTTAFQNIGKSFDLGTKGFTDEFQLFFYFGCLARTIQLLDGFVHAVKSRQLFVAGGLLRLNLDTYLRLTAKDLVTDKPTFFKAIFDGDQIDKMKDRDGNRLTDRFLSDSAGAKDSWVPQVYKHMSGYIHLSPAHYFGAVTSDGAHLHFLLGRRSNHIPLKVWFDMVQGFDHILTLIAGELQRMAIDLQVQIKGVDVVITTRAKAEEIASGFHGDSGDES
jgi:hypothetical protein